MMKDRRSGLGNGLKSILWLSFGALESLLFSFGELPPLPITILTLGGLTVVGIVTLRVTELSTLSRLFVLLFSLPFSATLGYLFDKNYIWWQTATNSMLCQNHALINEMLAMAIVGLCGLLAGMEMMPGLNAKTPSPQQNSQQPSVRTLSMLWVLVLLGFSLLLSWLHAPEKSIFVEAYASKEAGGGKDVEAGLNASCLISYLILILLYIDTGQERPGSPRRFYKLLAIAGVTSFIVVVLQFMRGDRESAGLIAALGMLYITGPSMTTARERLKIGLQQLKRLLRVLVPLFACAVAFLALGSLRNMSSQTQASHTNAWDVIVDGATKNTWTAVALNNLGLAADYNSDNLDYLYGRTYIDYLLSLPPRAVTMAMGIERPIDGDANPSMWYHGVTARGGMHPVIVPFRNFGIWGVLFIDMLVGMLIGYCEVGSESRSMARQLLFGFMAASAMRWFWYGDMNIIRTLMGWAIFYVFYQFAASNPRRVYTLPPPPIRTPRPRAILLHR